MIVFKIILSILIIGITTYLGFNGSKKLRKREEILRECVTFFSLVENEIQYMQSILPNAYEISRQKLNTNFKDVIGQIVVDMLSSDNYENCNQSIVENINNLSELTPYDKNIIVSTLKNLGRSDIESQINILENAKTVFNAQIEEAYEYKNKNSKMYKTVGTVVGIMLVIVLV